MHTVDGNWAAVVRELRKVIAENTVVKGAALAEDFSMTMFRTDSFHPFDDEAERLMSRVLRNMPIRCNYRNCESLATWKDFREQLSEAVWMWCLESEHNIKEYYNNSWNFAPGYIANPTAITFGNWDAISDKVFARVHRAALKGKQ